MAHRTLHLVLVIVLAFVSGSISAQAPEITVEWTQITEDRTYAVDWHPQGGYLAFGGLSTNTLTVFDWSTQSVLWNIAMPAEESDFGFGSRSTIRWSPDGQYIAVNVNDVVSIVEFETRTIYNTVGQTPTYNAQMSRFIPGLYHIEWSQDSEYVFVLNLDGYIDQYAIATGEVVETIDVASVPNMRGEGIPYEEFAVNRSNTLFVAPTNIALEPISPTVMFWDESGERVAFAQDNTCPVHAHHISEITDIDWANDDRTLAVAGATGYGVCRLLLNNEIESFQVAEGPVSALAWSPNQQFLAAALDTRQCLIGFSQPIRNAPVVESVIRPENCRTISLAWSPDSQYLVVASNEGLWIGRVTQQP